MIRTSLLFILFTLCGMSRAQEFLISQPSINACQGAFLDSGANPSNYGNNESFTSTICPDGSGPAISLQWIVFDLSTNGNAPIDQISIYDGPSTSDPLIGTWTGSDSPGIVSASFANVNGSGGGCLTVVFTSNNNGTGNFAASISCFQPCEPPTAVATFGSPVPLLACQNETITFDASASTAATGFTIVSQTWDFGDGTTGTGPVVQHSYGTPGEYVAQVEVVDDNGCVNTNLVDLQVLVSTTPLFTGTTPSTTICQGDEVALTTSPTAVTWSALPESNLGGGIFLPDLQGVPFGTGLQFTQFAPGQTLTDPLDLESICVSMEHSYMGDLVISITCPNGQSTVLHQQGGGGTYIGVPVDVESTPDVQGTCWDYCWSPTATNGTWADNSGGTLPSGTYESVQPFGNLVGCPLNGTWTFTVTDLFAIDNGFLCDWSLAFDPSLFPSLTTFTPILGVNSPDSAGWSGGGFIAGSTPTQGTAAPANPGAYPYTFSVTDNFGCTYDTTITITVTPSPQGPITITGDPVICEDGIAYLNAPAGFDTYVWSPNGAIGPNVNVGAGTYTVTVAFGNCPLTSDPFTVTEAPNPDPVITGLNFSCGGIPVTLSTTETYPTYQWSTNASSPSISATTGTYTVTVTNAEGCSGTSAPFDVVVANDPTAAFVFDPASPAPIGSTINFDASGSSGNGGAIDSYTWSFGEPDATGSGVDPSWTYEDAGLFTIILVVENEFGCLDTTSALLTIFPPEINIPNVFTPNGDGNNETFNISNIEFWNNDVRIYNRWGQVVKEFRNYRNTWNGSDVSDGTYFYEVVLSDGRAYTGHLTVLR
jgi:gliding motility-associated-like protein